MDFIKSNEIKELIQFAYTLHEEELELDAKDCWYVPNFKFNDGTSFETNRLNNGMVFADRRYKLFR